MLVGRATTSSLNGGGQCYPQPFYGLWYSLPATSQCPHGAHVGYEECTWRVVRKVRSLNYKCLAENGLKYTCEKDGGFPFSRSVDFLKKSVVSLERCWHA